MLLAELLLATTLAIGMTNAELAEQANTEFEQYVGDLKVADANLRTKIRRTTAGTSKANATAQTWGAAETVASDAGNGLLKALGIGGGAVGTGVTAWAAWKFLRRKREEDEGADADAPSTTVNVTGVTVQRPVKADLQAETK